MAHVSGWLVPLLARLRGLGVAPPVTAPPALAADDRVPAEFEEYLLGDRGLAVRTVEGYSRVARLFLASRCSLADDARDLERLRSADVSGGARTVAQPLAALPLIVLRPAELGRAVGKYGRASAARVGSRASGGAAWATCGEMGPTRAARRGHDDVHRGDH